MNDLPLSTLRVIDFTHVLAGPTCTMVLADLGAEVIKIESPKGDDSRKFGPFQNGASAYYNSINRNKLGICLNLKSEAGKKIAWDLIKIADILVENFRPGTLERLGFGYEMVKEKNPKLIYTSISGFGHTGPYKTKPAYDMVVQGMSGIMSITGELDSQPVRIGASMGDIIAGYQGVIAILAAITKRQYTGEGSHIDIAMLDAMVYSLENALARYSVEGIIPRPLGTAHPSITPFQAFKTKDKYIITPVGNDILWEKFCNALERTDLL